MMYTGTTRYTSCNNAFPAVPTWVLPVAIIELRARSLLQTSDDPISILCIS